MRPIGISIKAASDGSVSAMSPVAASTAGPSTWHSPLPYLFGGMAMMLLLIVSALLILACSYSKFTSAVENTAEAEQRSNQEAEEERKESSHRPRFVVIMAGEEKPTFLATPRCYRGFDSEDEEKQGMEDEEEMVRLEEGVVKEGDEDKSRHGETTTYQMDSASNHALV